MELRKQLSFKNIRTVSGASDTNLIARNKKNKKKHRLS